MPKLIDIDGLYPGFTYLLIECVNPEKNENRFYYLAWQPSLFVEGAVVRSYGRKDEARRTLSPLSNASLAEAWPLIWAILRWLRHRYKIVDREAPLRPRDKMLALSSA